jgi:hypothetical protein
MSKTASPVDPRDMPTPPPLPVSLRRARRIDPADVPTPPPLTAPPRAAPSDDAEWDAAIARAKRALVRSIRGGRL